MEEWKSIRLGDIVRIGSGLAYKADFLGSGDALLLGMGCVSFTEKFLTKGARAYSGASEERYNVSPGDIVLATRQQSDNLPILGMPAIIPADYQGKRLIAGSNLYIVHNQSDIDNRFLYWLLKTPEYINHISSCKTGTTVRMITKKDVESFVFKCPPKKEREKIADFLWSIEDKIDLNNRINHNLEEQAQALYKSWFIDFEPFRDGKFIDSDLGLIPEGWRIGIIGDIATISSGKRPNTKYETISAEHSIPVIGASSVMAYTDSVYQSERAIITGRVGTLGILQRVDIPCWPSDNTLIIKSTYENFVFQVLREVDYRSLNRGSTQPLLTQSDLKSWSIIIPPEGIIAEYESLIRDATDLIAEYHMQNQRLSLLRDTLLPQLMFGQLTC